MLPERDREGACIGVAVSAGADSVCLLEVLLDLRPRFGYTLKVIHLNHGLRGADSEGDARFVEALAASHGLEFHGRAIEAAREAEAAGDNVEQYARRARLKFFGELMSAGAVRRVATGHTRSDQAETVLLRMARGAGNAGLAGVLPVTREGLIRPLLRVGRAEVEEWLRARGMVWREDATNRDVSFQRNRVRHEVLPLMAQTLHPRIEEALAGLAEVARGEEEYWAEIAEAPEVRHGIVVLEAAALRDAPVALARRRARRALEAVKGDLRRIEFIHIERVLEMARGSEGSDRVQLPGLDVFRSFDRMRIAPAGYDNGVVREFEAEAALGSRTRMPDGSELRLSVSGPTARCGCDTLKLQLDWEKVLGLVEVTGTGLKWRYWRPGDRYQPAGRRNVAKVKEMFQEQRVPLWERRHWPLLVCGKEILWSRRFGPAGEYVAAPDSRTRVEISECAAKTSESRGARATSER